MEEGSVKREKVGGPAFRGKPSSHSDFQFNPVDVKPFENVSVGVFAYSLDENKKKIFEVSGLFVLYRYSRLESRMQDLKLSLLFNTFPLLSMKPKLIAILVIKFDSINAVSSSGPKDLTGTRLLEKRCHPFVDGAPSPIPKSLPHEGPPSNPTPSTRVTRSFHSARGGQGRINSGPPNRGSWRDSSAPNGGHPTPSASESSWWRR